MTIFRPEIYKAQRFNTKASIQIEGLTGSGKTGLSLIIARTLAGDWDSVGMIDTENRSANLYEGNVLSTGEKCGQFLKIDLTEDIGYAPTNYMACTDALINAGAKAVIADSITHAWQRTGGVLDQVNKLEQKIKGGSFRAWGDPVVVENKNALFEMLRNDKAHMITTVRVKEKFGMAINESTGKNEVQSLGEQQQTQEGIKYEPDLVLSMVSPGRKDRHPMAKVVKSRYPMLELDEVYEFTPELIQSIKDYLEEGADPEELIQRQKDEYIKAIVGYCQTNPTKKVLYDNLKNNAGFSETPIKEMPVGVIKSIYLELTN